MHFFLLRSRGWSRTFSDYPGAVLSMPRTTGLSLTILVPYYPCLVPHWVERCLFSFVQVVADEFVMHRYIEGQTFCKLPSTRYFVRLSDAIFDGYLLKEEIQENDIFTSYALIYLQTRNASKCVNRD